MRRKVGRLTVGEDRVDGMLYRLVVSSFAEFPGNLVERGPGGWKQANDLWERNFIPDSGIHHNVWLTLIVGGRWRSQR